jgi:hypothetical protein
MICSAVWQDTRETRQGQGVGIPMQTFQFQCKHGEKPSSQRLYCSNGITYAIVLRKYIRVRPRGNLWRTGASHTRAEIPQPLGLTWYRTTVLGLIITLFLAQGWLGVLISSLRLPVVACPCTRVDHRVL